MNILKFSGHDTFHCRQQWLSKGVKIIDNEGVGVLSLPEVAISKLGVGKNMVQSIQHWLKAFGLVDEKYEILDVSKKIFLQDSEYDPYLEDEGTLWLLQYKICHTNYASIYKIVFSEFFNDKISLEFSESQVIQFILKKLRDNNLREVSMNTLISDFKVFTKSYATPIKSLKTIEDDFNSPFLELNLISQLTYKNALGETAYRINKDSEKNIPISIFAYCILDYLQDRSNVSYDEIRSTVAAYFCLSNEGLENLIDSLCGQYNEFVYKNDAGVRQIQTKNLSMNFKNELLESYYGIQ
ncbi:DUF4007 family protein [Chryseobacterium indoltheticum]|jgi:hypothetical protein|uniref:DUF4007 family protein n=1 Tax=Chryseobacterium indoltheticum TaxID=254 RepID=UPI00242A99ED|nr:DUF4007 family protein [Chryseobacterium indoltheticum]MDF2833031.1 hypothetical protein [Chryseobacterium indoltheticum]